MKKNLFIFILSLILPVILSAQDKVLTIEDCIYRNTKLFPERVNNLQWIPATDSYSFIKNDTLFANNAKGNAKKILLTKKELLHYCNQNNLDIDSTNFPRMTWIDNNSFNFTSKATIYSFNISNKKIHEVGISLKETNVDKANLSYMYAYTNSNDLYIYKNGENICIAKSEGDNILYGSERVHRNEWGIDKGTFWSPNDNFLAFYRMDESMVTDYPLVNTETRIATVENIKYPMAGMQNHKVKIGIYNLNTKQTIYLQTNNDVDQFLTCVSWDPSENYIYTAILNREQNNIKLNKYDVYSGNFVKTLFEETNSKYVEPLQPLLFISKDKTKFIWQSRRDGWNHLYLYDTQGNLVKKLTSGNWEVTDVLGFNSNESVIYVMATKDSPIEENLYAVNIKTQTLERLTQTHGTHYCTLSHSKKYFIDNFSNINNVNSTKITSIDGKTSNILLDAPDPLQDYKKCKVIVDYLTNDNGDKLYYRIILPADFKETEKYPVFYYVYGGPHLQMITDSRNGGASYWDLRWAQRGYIVFSLDNRGTPHRGADFEQCIHRHLGYLEIKDQMVGINYLKSLSYVDTSKMAVNGWSYGGFMTISMMLKQNDVFKVGVAGGPVIDWEYYEIMYGERYMDTPKENPDGYKEANLNNHVDKLKGKLLIIHCTTDPVVVWQNSLTFINKCIKAGKQVDYFVYPGHEHNVRGTDRAHLYKKIETYIDNNISN